MVRLIPNIVEYVGATQTLRVTNLKLGSAYVTDQTAGVSVTYALVAVDGTALGSGTLAYVAGTDATWEADLTVPDRPNEAIHVHLTAQRGSSVGKWHGVIRVKAFV
jgi:hypothetical protein